MATPDSSEQSTHSHVFWEQLPKCECGAALANGVILPPILADETERAVHLARLAHKQAERWQEMAELLWEELQEWHADDCAQGDGAPCTCHRILATKWDEITNAADWADDEEEADRG